MYFQRRYLTLSNELDWYGGGPILAYTTNQHLILDVDDVSLGRVHKIAQWTQKIFKAGDCLVVKSSSRVVHKFSRWARIKLYLKWWALFWINRESRMDTLADVLNKNKYEVGSYYLIFNNKMSWEQIVHAIRILAARGYVDWRFFTLRQTKMDLTVRYTHKWYYSQGKCGIKPAPEIVEYLRHKSDKRDEMMDNYIVQAGLSQQFVSKVMHLPTLSVHDSCFTGLKESWDLQNKEKW